MEFVKGTISTVRSVNRSSILEIIKKHQPISRAAIARKFSMSRSAVSAIVDELLAEGLIREGGIGDSTPRGGRRSVNLEFVPTAKYAFGIDIGATKTILLLTDLSGNVVRREKILSHADGVDPLTHIRAHAERFLAGSGIEVSKIVGTGIGVPGTTDFEAGVVVNAPGLNVENLDVRAFFGQSLPKPIYVDNDVNMAVIGERWKGNGVSYRDVVLIAVGTAIGAGLLIGGKVHRGANGFAGEIGYFHVDPLIEDYVASPHEFGPLDKLASGTGIQNQAMALLAHYPNSILQKDHVTSEKVFEAASAGDELAKLVIDRTIRYLAFGISNLVAILNPNVVLIGGGISEVGEEFVAKIAERLQNLTPVPVRVMRAKLGEDAGAFGAAATALIGTNHLGF